MLIFLSITPTFGVILTCLFSDFTVGYNGELYIFGGYNARLNRHFHDLWKFDPGIKLAPFIDTFMIRIIMMH